MTPVICSQKSHLFISVFLHVHLHRREIDYMCHFLYLLKHLQLIFALI